jgi:hypothetical protein
LRWAELIRSARRMMLVVGPRRDETIGVAGIAESTSIAVVAGGVIDMASAIETRGEGIGIAARSVVDTGVIGKPARVVSRVYSIHAARLHKPAGESRGCSADDESRREYNLGLVQHWYISLKSLLPRTTRR